MDRIIHWLILKIGVSTIITLSLLLAIAGSTAFGLANLVFPIDDAFLWPAVLLGTLAGWFLGRSSLSSWKSAIAGVFLILSINLYYFGKLSGPLAAWISRGGTLVLAALRFPSAAPPDPNPFLLASTSLWASLNAVVVRILTWIETISTGKSSGDTLPVALIWSLAMWGFALWAAWKVRRQETALQAVLPAAVVLAVVMNYRRENPLNLAVLLGFALLLMVAASQRGRQRRWIALGIDYSNELELDLALVAGPLVVLIILTSLVMPSISVKRIMTAVWRLTQPSTEQIREVGKSLGLGEPGSQAYEVGGLRVSPGLPRSHLLGSSPDLSKRTVMTISTGDLPPGPNEIINYNELPNYYWRSATYAQYTGRGWMNGDIETDNRQAGEVALWPGPKTGSQETMALVDLANLPGYRIVRQEVRGVLDLGGVMFATGIFLTSDVDYQILWRAGTQPIKQAKPDTIWLEGGDLFGVKVDQNQYQAYSLLPVVSEAELRSAGAEYPTLIAESYLALPESLPERVVALAREITIGLTNPYERANALEAYLREIPYNLDIPAPPPGRDVADYFLFDLRQGYCDYYATAMAVMTRSLGLPTRLVIGYARGSYNPYAAQFIISAADAHSWVEIYFPQIGWVEFEPTGGRPPIQRPETIEEQPVISGQPPDFGQIQPSTGFRLRSLYESVLSPRRLFMIFTALAMLAGVLWFRIDDWRLRRLSPGATLARLFRILTHHGRSLAFSPSGATPYEFSNTISGCLDNLGQTRLLGGIWKPAAIDVRQLTDLYTHAAYSPRQPGWKEKWRAIRLWRNLRWRLWAARLVQGFKRSKVLWQIR